MTEKPIAIVTGVGPGTGAAIVKRFSAGGFRIIALARSTEIINSLAQELPDVHAMTCDVSDESQVRTVATDVKRRFGAAEVLIHNAVGGGWGSFREIDPKMLNGNFEVNVMGLLYLAREVAPDMIDRGRGAILVTGNTSSIRGKANFAGFAPTKAAQRILAESIARDMGPLGIHVACVLIDAVIDTPRMRARMSDKPDEFFIKRTGDEPGVGGVLATGAGSAFCSGGDVQGMGGNSAAAPAMSFSDKVARLRERQRTLTGVLVSVRKPTIAALPGPAAGAGLAIALACDIRIAAESTIMTTGYAKIALTGDYGISWLLTRLAGTARARELMFLSERIDARRCEALGLVNRVVPDVDLQTEAFEIARTLANGPGSAFASIKDNLDLALSADFLMSLDHEAERMVTAASPAPHC